LTVDLNLRHLIWVLDALPTWLPIQLGFQLVADSKKLLIIRAFWKQHDSVTLRVVAAPFIVAKDFEKNLKNRGSSLMGNFLMGLLP
jgi:hypothetical protein